MSSSGHWILLDSLFFVNNLFLYGKGDEPLDLLLRRIFSGVVGKMMSYAECSHGLHVLSNTIDDAAGAIQTLELDYLYVSPSVDDYLQSALVERQPTSEGAATDLGLPDYARIRVADFEAKGLRDYLINLLTSHPPCFPNVRNETELKQLFTFLNKGTNILDTSDKLSSVDCKADSILVIPLAEPSSKLPASNLGAILLWGSRQRSIKANLESRGERLIAPAKTISVFLRRLFESRHSMSNDTYLPSYRRAGEKKVAIMFADIRDFTPTTEICRNFNLIDVWKEFMLDYCGGMCEIIQKNGGRIHALAGDGIVALFGEYVSDIEALVKSAVDAAMEMCIAFDTLRQDFFSKESISSFFEQEYEPLDFRLGIGIDLGTVIFDYFGAPGSRLYSPLGDHINFAQRLESQAARYDGKLGRQRAPILISRPAWRAARSYLPFSEVPITLHVKGKPYEYQAYEVDPSRST